jgi:asparagine synthase (glutamine-hydrolysing)
MRYSADQAPTAAAARAGVDTVLTGFGADDIFDMQPSHIADLLRRGQLWAAWREASRWAHADGMNAWSLLGPYGFANVAPAWMRMGVANWLRGGYAPWGRNTEWTIAPWIRPDFARRMGLRDRILTHLRRSNDTGQSIRVSLLVSALRANCAQASRWYVAAPNGILLTHPFLDSRVLSMATGTLSRVTAQPGAQKPVLAAAMRNILPDCILNRPAKGHFNETFYVGLSRNLPQLEALVEQAPVDDLGFLDKATLLDCLQRTALGNAGNLGALLPLMCSLSLLVWLTQQRVGIGGREAGLDQAPAGRRRID